MEMPHVCRRTGSSVTNEAHITRQRLCCDSCASMKVRCDGEKPRCSKCRLKGKLCHYTALRRGGRPRNSDYLANTHRGIATGDSDSLRRIASASARYSGIGKSPDTVNFSSPQDGPENIGNINTYTDNLPDIKERDTPLPVSSSSLNPFSNADLAVPGLQGRDHSGIGDGVTNRYEVYDLCHGSQYWFTGMQEATPSLSYSASPHSPSDNFVELLHSYNSCPCQAAMIMLLKCRTELRALASYATPAISGLTEAMAKLILSSHERCNSCGADEFIRHVIKCIIQDSRGAAAGDRAETMLGPERGTWPIEPVQHQHSGSPVWTILGEGANDLSYTDGALQQLASEVSGGCPDSFWMPDTEVI